MPFGFITGIVSSAGIGWLLRRIPDWGGQLLGWLGGLAVLFMQLDPVTQAAVAAVLQGNWQNVTLGSLAGVILFGVGQWRSYRATVKPQVVTSGGTKIEVPVLTEDQARAATGYTGPIENRVTGERH